jgi:hypothetical protein
VWEGVAQWQWEFSCVLGRNARNCYRNPGNLLARTFLMVLIAFMQVTTYRGRCRHADDDDDDDNNNNNNNSFLCR